MGNRTNEWIKQKRKEQIQQHGGKCQDCNSRINLEFAHIKPTLLKGKNRGRKERYYDIKKHPKCYRLLCHKCHKKRKYQK